MERQAAVVMAAGSPGVGRGPSGWDRAQSVLGRRHSRGLKSGVRKQQLQGAGLWVLGALLPLGIIWGEMGTMIKRRTS